MAKSLERYFQFMSGAAEAKPSGKLWYPAADVFETEDGWMVRVELAGVSIEDIEIKINGNQLYLAGCRKDKSCSGGVTYQQMEITYSHFEKTLEFPASIDGAHIEPNFDNGILNIHLKKA